ncbi:hypothetical protein FNF31_03007 [Cafeteria roenbergensis]|uniref:Uncharacterized protein n=1 Tax=Cafeteria roenbergensis TaxID=33653 RepID=A0A5A8DGL9_CAFRO|nr:hypothetical protein FNF31_03007 [Cafeteria roenbergensis]
MVSMIGAIQQSQGQSGTARGSCMAVMSAISVLGESCREPDPQADEDEVANTRARMVQAHGLGAVDAVIALTARLVRDLACLSDDSPARSGQEELGRQALAGQLVGTISSALLVLHSLLAGPGGAHACRRLRRSAGAQLFLGLAGAVPTACRTALIALDYVVGTDGESVPLSPPLLAGLATAAEAGPIQACLAARVLCAVTISPDRGKGASLEALEEAFWDSTCRQSRVATASKTTLTLSTALLSRFLAVSAVPLPDGAGTACGAGPLTAARSSGYASARALSDEDRAVLAVLQSPGDAAAFPGPDVRRMADHRAHLFAEALEASTESQPDPLSEASALDMMGVISDAQSGPGEPRGDAAMAEALLDLAAARDASSLADAYLGLWSAFASPMGAVVRSGLLVDTGAEGASMSAIDESLTLTAGSASAASEARRRAAGAADDSADGSTEGVAEGVALHQGAPPGD